MSRSPTDDDGQDAGPESDARARDRLRRRPRARADARLGVASSPRAAARRAPSGRAACASARSSLEGARTPRRYRCQPDLVRQAAPDAGRPPLKRTQRVSPVVHHSALRPACVRPACARLRGRDSPGRARTAPRWAPSNIAVQPYRETNLRVRLVEYLPFGLEAGHRARDLRGRTAVPGDYTRLTFDPMPRPGDGARAAGPRRPRRRLQRARGDGRAAPPRRDLRLRRPGGRPGAPARELQDRASRRPVPRRIAAGSTSTGCSPRTTVTADGYEPVWGESVRKCLDASRATALPRLAHAFEAQFEARPARALPPLPGRLAARADGGRGPDDARAARSASTRRRACRPSGRSARWASTRGSAPCSDDWSKYEPWWPRLAHLVRAALELGRRAAEAPPTRARWRRSAATAAREPPLPRRSARRRSAPAQATIEVVARQRRRGVRRSSAAIDMRRTADHHRAAARPRRRAALPPDRLGGAARRRVTSRRQPRPDRPGPADRLDGRKHDHARGRAVAAGRSIRRGTHACAAGTRRRPRRRRHPAARRCRRRSTSKMGCRHARPRCRREAGDPGRLQARRLVGLRGPRGNGEHRRARRGAASRHPPPLRAAGDRPPGR